MTSEEPPLLIGSEPSIQTPQHPMTTTQSIRDASRIFFSPLALSIFLGWSDNAASAADVSSALAQIAESSGLARNSIAYCVIDAATGATVAARNADAPMAPASNMKVLTTGAALLRLGGEFQFQTRLVASATGEGAAQSVRLTVVGGGDPALGDPELLKNCSWVDENGVVHQGLGTTELLTSWVDGVRSAGITRVSEVVVDARIFESEGFHPSWPAEQAAAPFCAEVWGLNFHANTVDILPRVVGKSATIGVMDPPYDWLPSTAASSGKKSNKAFWVGRVPGSNALSYGGNVVANPKDQLALTVHDTPVLFAELLARRLKAAGIDVQRSRVATASDPTPEGTTIGAVFQTPIAVVLKRANTDSQNLYAECLFKRMGSAAANHPLDSDTILPGPTVRPGSWANGADALRAIVAQRVDANTAQSWVIADGCGLARENRITATGLARWLRSFAIDAQFAAMYFDSFAVAGKTGTVSKRFNGLEKYRTTVQCKTGYIRGVSCLSGRVDSGDGRQFLFAILGNNLSGDGVAKARKVQEDIVWQLVRELEPTPQASRTNSSSKPSN